MCCGSWVAKSRTRLSDLTELNTSSNQCLESGLPPLAFRNVQNLLQFIRIDCFHSPLGSPFQHVTIYALNLPHYALKPAC